MGENDIDDKEHYENEEIQSINSIPNNASQVKGENNDNGINDVGRGEETNQSLVVLRPITEVQLVEVPLSYEFDGMRNQKGKGKATKVRKGNWKRLEHGVVSPLHIGKYIQNKWKNSPTHVEEEKAYIVLIDNTRMALAELAKGHDLLAD